MKTSYNNSVISREIDNGYYVILNNINKINIINSSLIENQLLQMTKESETTLFLDLSDVNFIDSKGFNTILKVKRTAFLNNVNFIICNVNEEVLELFDLLGLNNEFEISKKKSLRKNLERAS